MGFDEVWNRTKEATGLKTFVELAHVVGVQQSAISKAKKKEEFPDRWIFLITNKYDLNSDWLKFGIGPTRRDEDRKEGWQPVKPDIEPVADYGRRESDLALAKGFELLAKIYGSGDQVLIRAIVANLSAFSESIDNKARAIEAEGRMAQMDERLKTLEKHLAELVGARGNGKAANGQ